MISDGFGTKKFQRNMKFWGKFFSLQIGPHQNFVKQMGFWDEKIFYTVRWKGGVTLRNCFWDWISIFSFDYQWGIQNRLQWNPNNLVFLEKWIWIFSFLSENDKYGQLSNQAWPLRKYRIASVFVSRDSWKNVDIFEHKKFEDCFIDSQEIIG